MPSIVYIDPQSYNNLSLYDCGMLSQMPAKDVVLIGSDQWDCNMPNAEFKPWFTYNSKKNPIEKGLSYVSTILRIKSFIKRHKDIKIVHIQWLRIWQIDILFAKWLQRRGIKVVFTAHNLLPHDTGDSQRKKYSEYYHTVDKICVHTKSTKDDLVSIFGIPENKVAIVPHGILETDVVEDSVRTRTLELRHKYHLESHHLIFSSLGLQSYYKGVDNLIKIWSETKELNANSNIKLFIVGKNSGVDYKPIENLTNVLILDEKVSNEDFQAYLELSDIVLLPYRVISQSGVLFSAISRNKPVVVSNVGGLPDPLKIGDVGWNIGEPTEDNLKGVLLELANNPDKAKEKGTKQSEFAKVRDYYSWDSISKCLRNLYKILINQK